ncbi:hypothetical protein SGPA1_30381 [Streptomyces misionensis JCM 4497]
MRAGAGVRPAAAARPGRAPPPRAGPGRAAARRGQPGPRRRLRGRRGAEPDTRPVRRGRPRRRRHQGPPGRQAQADRRRRPEQLPLGLPQPEHRGRPAGGLRHRPGAPHRPGHPRRPGRGAVQGDTDQPAHPGDPGRPGGHGGAHHDHHLRPARPGRVLGTVLQDRAAGPRPQVVARHRLQRHARGQEGVHGGRFDGVREAGRRQEVRDAARLHGHLHHGAQPAGLPGAAPARRGGRGGHRRRPRREPGRPGPDRGTQGRAVHDRVLRSGDEEGRHRSGTPGQPGTGRLPRERLAGVVRHMAVGDTGKGLLGLQAARAAVPAHQLNRSRPEHTASER